MNNKYVLYTILILFIILSAKKNVKEVLEKIKLKESIIERKNIDNSTLKYINYFKKYNDKIIHSGKLKDRFETYFEILSYPDLNLLYREYTTIKDDKSRQGDSFAPSQAIIHNNKLYRDYTSRDPEWIIYYDLETFERVKVKEIGNMTIRLFSSLSENEILAYKKSKIDSIIIFDNDLNIKKSITTVDIAKELGIEEFSDFRLILRNNNLVYFKAGFDAGVIDLNTFKSKFINHNNIKDKGNKLILNYVHKIGNSIYLEYNDVDFHTFRVYNYNYENNELKEIDEYKRIPFLSRLLYVQIDDLSFLYSFPPELNELIIIKGDFEKMLLLKVNKLKNITAINGVERFGDSYVLGTGDGFFEIKIDDLNRFFEEYGEKIPTHYIEMP